MEVTIKAANESDFELVAAVFMDELAFHAELLPDRFQVVTRTMTRHWFRDIVTSEDKDIIVAQLDSNIVGVLQIEMRQTPDLPFIIPRCYAYVADMAIAKGLRFRGYGRNLMQGALDWARERDAEAVELNVWELNTDAISFYERLGFSSVRRRLSYGLSSSA